MPPPITQHSNIYKLYINSEQELTNKKMNYTNDQQLDTNTIINKLIQSNSKDIKLKQAQIRTLCIKARQIFMKQPMLLQLEAPVKIAGDIHGQYSDLLKVFQKGGYPGDVNYLFLGDYVDRGKKSIQCICLLLAFKIKHPQNFFLLRGNHQCQSINRIYGFYDQCKRKYNLKIWRIFTDVFNAMPVAALIDEKIICMHGGLSPQLKDFEQIKKIERPATVPDQGLLCDLLWSDPEKTTKGWIPNSERGVSLMFGPDVIQNFLKDHNLDLICRAHQIVQEGYQFLADRKLVTIFSATNYCGEFDNSGAMMNVDQQLICSFQVIPGNNKK